jgi:hypothetical protein
MKVNRPYFRVARLALVGISLAAILYWMKEIEQILGASIGGKVVVFLILLGIALVAYDSRPYRVLLDDEPMKKKKR